MLKTKLELSIIIPCYNVEKYIVKCLDSISNQLGKINYEVLLIDDKSTDNTNCIIKQYIKSSEMNITLLENERNLGAGASRNKAVNIAKYDNISFIDADDYLDSNYYEIMLQDMIKNNLDVIVCDINLVYQDGSPTILGYGCNGSINKINIINSSFAASPCNKIIKKQLLLDYPFAEGIMNEDIASIIAIVANSKKVGYTPATHYNYVQRNDSVQNIRLSEKRFDIFKSIDILKQRIHNSKDYSKIIDAVAFQQLFLFFVYVIPREKNIFRRTIFLKKFYKLSRNFNFKNNVFLQNDMALRNKKEVFYFNLIFNANQLGFSFFTSFIMFLFSVYHSVKHSRLLLKKRSVIKANITMKDLIKMARYQFLLSDNKSKISVVIPNYNYNKFLYERIYSILYQKYKLYELIILDDCSSDDSKKTIDDIVDKLSPFIKISKHYNQVNSGTPFKQWKKGFELADGDYVWIAEADDYCKNDLVSSIMKYMDNDNDISIGYVDTSFINSIGEPIIKSIKSEIDIQKTGHWDKDFVNYGDDEIYNYSYLNCTIANVSSCIIKKYDYSITLEKCCNYKQVGDWLFYINAMKKGKVLFVNKPINYYRVHGNNVTSITKKENHVNEIMKLYSIFKKEFKLDKEHIKKMNDRLYFLRRVWNIK